MTKHLRALSKASGLAPGTLVHVGERRSEKVRITVIDYDEKNVVEKTLDKIEDSLPFKDAPTVTWLNIDGLHDLTIVEKVGEMFSLHPLILEDVVNTTQRPKLEDYDSCVFVVMKMLYDTAHGDSVIAEQVSMIMGKGFVITFQEQEGDVFEMVRTRIRQGKGRIRKKGADYLVFSLMDSIVDKYFSILETFGESIEEMEETLAKDPTPDKLKLINRMKREAMTLRRSVWPLREIISGLQRQESSLVKKESVPYFRDLYDHTIQVMDTIESYRDMISGMLDIYMSSLSNKMNEVMKVLTIFAAIFIPLTFIAGVYGMNFEYMPELKWHYAYFGVLALMLAVALTMLGFFKKQKWF